MGFLDNLFRQQNAEIFTAWKILQTEDQLDALMQQSKNKPVVIFKHSISCGISANIKYQLEKHWDFTEEELEFHYLDLITYRPISNKIEAITGVIHQSPQIIVLKNGKAVFNTSHHLISVAAIRQAL